MTRKDDVRRSESPRARARAGVGATVLVLAVGAAACSSGSGHTARNTQAAKVAGTFPRLSDTGTCDVAPTGDLGGGSPPPSGPGAGTAPTVPPSIDVGPTGSGPGSGNPYTVVGARPVPGPGMTNTTLGPDPVSRVVAIPPNPDVGSPAGTPAGATTVPTPPTTAPPPLPSTPTTAPGATTPTTVAQLMKPAPDPGCVAGVDDP